MRYQDRSHFSLIAQFMDGLEKQHSFYAARIDKHIDEEDSESHREGLQHMIKVEVEIMRAAYETAKNPIFIFRGFMCCVDGRLNIPDWIKDYFYEASLRLLDAAYSGDDRSEKDILAHALDFKSSGRGNYFKQYLEILKQYSKLAEVMRVKLSSDISFEEIEGQVASEAFPDDVEAAEKFQRNLRGWREKLQQIPDDLFRR